MKMSSARPADPTTNSGSSNALPGQTLGGGCEHVDQVADPMAGPLDHQRDRLLGLHDLDLPILTAVDETQFLSGHEKTRRPKADGNSSFTI